jgi:hypothetical protein
MLARVVSRTMACLHGITLLSGGPALYIASVRHTHLGMTIREGQSTRYKLALKFHVQSQSCRSPSTQHQCMLQQSTIIILRIHVQHPSVVVAGDLLGRVLEAAHHAVDASLGLLGDLVCWVLTIWGGNTCMHEVGTSASRG